MGSFLLTIGDGLFQSESCFLWLEDLSVRLLALVILDRFADYVSDEVSEKGELTKKCSLLYFLQMPVISLRHFFRMQL